MRPPGRSQISMLVLSLGVAGTAPVRASPPVVDMGESRVVITEAESLLRAEEWDKAIDRFEDGLERLPAEPGYAPTRARVLLRIVDAHEAAFRDDRELDRLGRASRLLDDYLGPLHLLDEEGRAAAEERRRDLLATIRRVKEEKRKEVARKAELDAQKAAAGRAAADARRRGQMLSRSGAALASVGIAGLGVMGAGLGLGVVTDRALSDLTAKGDWSTSCSYLSQDCQDERRAEFDPLLARGQASNMMMIGGGVTGGVFLVSGITLLVLGGKQKRKADRMAILPLPTATARSLGVVFQGHF